MLLAQGEVYADMDVAMMQFTFQASAMIWIKMLSSKIIFIFIVEVNFLVRSINCKEKTKCCPSSTLSVIYYKKIKVLSL